MSIFDLVINKMSFFADCSFDRLERPFYLENYKSALHHGPRCNIFFVLVKRLFRANQRANYCTSNFLITFLLGVLKAAIWCTLHVLLNIDPNASTKPIEIVHTRNWGENTKMSSAYVTWSWIISQKSVVTCYLVLILET